MSNLQLLDDLGLTKAESQIYLALQELGEAKTGTICNKLDIHSSHIYRHLDSLTQKGLVSYKLANKVKIYVPTKPEALQLLFENKQKALQKQKASLLQLIEELKKTPKNKETNTDYQYFEGIPALKSMALEVYSNASNSSSMYLFSSRAEAWEKINAFYLDCHKIRVKRNIQLQMIAQKGSPDIGAHVKERQDIGLIETKYLDLANMAEFLVSDNALIIQYVSKDTATPCGFMIKNKVFIETFKIIFGCLWGLAK
jgi:sugar-specific transcriptional regulator TrmB